MVENDNSTVFIPSGAFIMGTDIEPFYGTILDQCRYAKLDEAPIHARHLDSYRIDKFPVTNAEYIIFVRETGHTPPTHWKNGDLLAKDENKPVIQVSWYDCQAYAEWIGKRLPTEAEWEKASRGPDGRIYPWGDILNPEVRKSRFTLTDDSNYYSTELNPVGMYKKNISPYGVCDTVGGVWEWTSESYMSYPESNNEDGKNINPEHYVLRGGSWMEARDGTAQRYYRCANRLHSPPSFTGDNIGFRCVEDIEPKTVSPVQVKIEQVNEYIDKKKLNNLHIIKNRSRKNCIIDALISLFLIFSSIWGSIRKPEWILGGITFGIIGVGFLFTAGVNFWRFWCSSNKIRQIILRQHNLISKNDDLDSFRKNQFKPTL